MILYGIKHCDTVKKARTWLGEHAQVYEFHDYQKSGIDRERLTAWCQRLGWERVLNRAGTTFRKLHDAQREGLDEARAIGLMLAQPSLIKRPMLEAGSQLLVGFDPERYRVTLLR